MLMLSRKTNEAIMIGDDIRVTITHIGRGRVQIAVDAPREVRAIRHSDRRASSCAATGTRRCPTAVGRGALHGRRSRICRHGRRRRVVRRMRLGLPTAPRFKRRIPL